MIPAQRRALLLDYIKQHGAASVRGLARRVNCSESTVRRDLDFLSEQGYLRRSYGGADLLAMPSTTFEPDAVIGSHQNHDIKCLIGAAGAEWVDNGLSIVFDSSSTVLELAKEVVRRHIALTAVTNDLSIATLLASAPKVKLIVPGGSLRPGSFTLTGEPGGDFLERLHVDLAFIGVHAITNGLLSDTSVEVVTIKQKLMKAARRVIVLADASKFSPAAFYKIASLDDVDELITDDRASPENLAEARSRRAKVTVVKTPVDDSEVQAP